MQIHQNYSLRALNTFGLEARAEHFVSVESVTAIQSAIQAHIRPVLVLGGGSNLLLTRDVPGLVLKNSIQGIKVLRSFKHKVWVEVGGGVIGRRDVVAKALVVAEGGAQILPKHGPIESAAAAQEVTIHRLEKRVVHLFRADAARGYVGEIEQAAVENRFPAAIGFRKSDILGADSETS